VAPRLSLVFFASGAASLIFEAVWFHRCGLVFGNSVWATSLVLSSFMAGLAVGNAAVARRGWQIRRPIRAYALLEVVVAVSGLAATLILPAMTGAFVSVARTFVEDPWLVNLARVAMAFVVLVVPTTAMGATLPVLVEAASREEEGFGHALGRLYGWNTLGAVVGVVGAEVVLIARFGVTTSAVLAGVIDLGAAAWAFQLSRSGLDRTNLKRPANGSAVIPGWKVARLALATFLAGGTLMALEVLWFRFLMMFIIPSTLVVAIMLAVVLTAIAVGGLTAALVTKRSGEDLALLPTFALVAGATVVASYLSFRSLTEGAQITEWYRAVWMTLVLTFPTSVVSGMLFTLFGVAFKRRITAAAVAAGLMTLLNTAGAMLGPLMAAFVLLPFLGVERSLWGAALVYGVVGLLTVRGSLAGMATMGARACVAAGLVTALLLGFFPFGMMQTSYFIRAASAYLGDGARMIASREGPSETIFLLEKDWLGKPVYHRLVTNGFSMTGTSTKAKRYMRYFVYWPMLLHEAPLRRVLLVGYGAGVTAKAITALKSVESMDVVEISRDVVAMSDLIYSPADHPLRDTRVRLHVEDGRQYLLTTKDRFDLITGEPPPPGTPGTVNLYTREYFQLLRDRLVDGGIVTYWLPVAREGGYNTSAVIRAFCDAFDDCSLWNGTPSDLMLVGTNRLKGPVSVSHFAQAWNDSTVWSDMREVGFETPAQIGATFLGDAGYLRRITEAAAPLTDDFPRRLLWSRSVPSLSDPRFVDYYHTVLDPGLARGRFEKSELVRGLWPSTLSSETLPFFEAQQIINKVLLEGANTLRDIEDLHFLLTRTSLRRPALWALDSDDVQQLIADSGDDGTGLVEYTLGVRSLVARNYVAAAEFFSTAEQRGYRSATTRPLLVYALCLAGRLSDAALAANGASSASADERHFWGWLGVTYGVKPQPW